MGVSFLFIYSIDLTFSCEYVHIFIACLPGRVCTHAVWGHRFVLERAQCRAPTVFSRSHLGRNPLCVKSIPQWFHTVSPSMLPSSRLPRALLDTWFRRRRTLSRKSPKWWSRCRGGQLMRRPCARATAGVEKHHRKRSFCQNEVGRKTRHADWQSADRGGLARLCGSKPLIRRVFVLSFVVGSPGTRTRFSAAAELKCRRSRGSVFTPCMGKSITFRRVMLDQSGAETKSVSDCGVN